MSFFGVKNDLVIDLVIEMYGGGGQAEALLGSYKVQKFMSRQIVNVQANAALWQDIQSTDDLVI